MLKRVVFLLVVLLIAAHPTKAQKEYQSNDSNLEADPFTVCALSVARMEEKYDIKEHLLETIASVETGLWDYNKEAFISWPWSVNVNGKGYRFASKEEAIAKVKSLQKEGYTSIDVGCMQISLKYHGDAFESIEAAFDPDTNVEYSAKFLKNLYHKKGNWQQAAMAYHSKVLEHANIYKEKLLKRFNEIKVAFLGNDQNLSLF